MSSTAYKYLPFIVDLSYPDFSKGAAQAGGLGTNVPASSCSTGRTCSHQQGRTTNHGFEDRVEFEKDFPGRGGGRISCLTLWRANLIWEGLALAPGVP